MHRWERSHRRMGVSAPSWLTFEIHRPYLDGGDTPRTAIQARGPLVAAQLFADRDPATPRFGMVMPPSYRRLLTEESRLAAYRIENPLDLPPELASPGWQRMYDGYRRFSTLDDVDRAGLALWLVAVCLPGALLTLMPADLDPGDCADPARATLQAARAMALFQCHGLGDSTAAAFAPVLHAPRATVAQMQSCAAWAYFLARHATDATEAQQHAGRARRLYAELAPGLSSFDQAVWQARLLAREVMLADRAGHLDRAQELLDQAANLADAAPAGSPVQQEIATELRRRILDRRVEIAVKRHDNAAEEAAVAEVVALDPYCVKVRMQQAQLAQRRGDLAAALAAYLTAARLGPHGTAFALLGAAKCAQQLGQEEVRRVLAERAFRAAPRSEHTRAALVEACLDGGDKPLAQVVRQPGAGYRGNWHYRMYAPYFNLGPAQSPCLYAGIPTFAYEFAIAGAYPRIDVQRVMPPAFRRNLTCESGLTEFDVSHPAGLPPQLRTPQWEQLCEWVTEFPRAGLNRQYLTCMLLFRLGFRSLLLELVPERPVADLREPLEFYLYHWRDIARFADSVGGRSPVPPRETFEMVDHPDCPPHARLGGAVFAVVFAARETKSLTDAVYWRKRAEEFLTEMLNSTEFTPFEKVMMESRFYRGVGFVPFMRGDREGTIAEMSRAEELARAVLAVSPWEEYLKRENLHACLESRSKEAIGLGDVALARRRTEEFLALDPYDPKSHIELAECLAKQEQYRGAGESYLRAARLGPLGTALAYSMAGECFDRAGDKVLAEDCFVQALRLDPYAISAARGWRRTAGPAMSELAAEYCGGLEAWGESRRARI